MLDVEMLPAAAVNGVASTTWTLGGVAGVQTLTASGAAEGGPITFTATAVQPALAIITLLPARIDFGSGQSSVQVQMTQLDAAGNPLDPAASCVWNITSVRESMSVTGTGVVSSTRADAGIVSATCGGLTATSAVESGDFQFSTSASIQDPEGDAQPSSGGSPDFIGMTASIAQRSLTVSADFALASLGSGVTVLTTVAIDIDQNVGTGHPGLSAGGDRDNQVISADYLITIEGGQANLLRYAGTVNSFTFVASTACVTTGIANARTYSCTFPLSQLGYDDGYLNFKATSSAKVSSNGYSGILDQITDLGLAPGSTGAAIP